MNIAVNIVGLALASCLGLVHIFASQTQWLSSVPQRWWVSIAGGVSIAYIFLDILPELSHAQTEIQHSSIGMIGSKVSRSFEIKRFGRFEYLD